MKRTLFIISFFVSSITFSQVGIGTTNPDASSALDVTATNKGVLIPRVLVAQRITISSPAEGLLVYQTDDIEGFYYYDGLQWIRLLDKDKDAVPVGAIFSFPVATAPSGYLECDGSAVSRTTYADLFALISSTYGAGDGSTTFNLPDYRGQFLRGFDNGAGEDPDVTSRTDRGDGIVGDNIGTKQDFDFAQHLHNHSLRNVVTANAGNHNHSLSGLIYTNTIGNHSHYTSAETINTSTYNSGSHNHQRGSYTRQIYAYGTGSIPINIYQPSTGGTITSYTNTVSSHNHIIAIPIPSRNTNATGNHNHTVSLNGRVTNGNGNHSHNTTIPAYNSNNTGGNETRPKNVSVLWCIKY